MEYRRSDQFPQINAIIEELSTEAPQTVKIVALLRELLKVLVANPTKSACEEVDWLCMVINDKYVFSRVTGKGNAQYNWELPLKLEYILDDCILLHDYPSDFAPSPTSLLKRIDDYIKKRGL